MKTRADNGYLQSRQWKAVRSRVMARDGYACVICGSTEALEVDHIIERIDWPEGEGGLHDMDNLRTLCRPHHGAKSTKARLARGKRRKSRSSRAPADPARFSTGEVSPEPPGGMPKSPGVEVGPEDLAVGWTESAGLPWGIDAMPPEAVWPRFMSAPHPRAVGTYGPEFVAWANARPKMHPKSSGGLRWWQVLVAYRALEHDSDGRLVWRTVILTVARQLGKSWLTRALLSWRSEQAERFGEVQTCVSTAHKLLAAQEIWRSAARWYSAAGTLVRLTNGEQMIEHRDGSRWILQAANDGLAVGYSVSMGLVDEAWRVGRDVFDGALLPTMAESESPQAWLVSTAGDAASDLMLAYRRMALEALDEPDTVLLIEWSALPDADPEDEDAWRAASPHWNDNRRNVVAHAKATMSEDEFATQFMNRWIKRKMNANMWVDADVWAKQAEPHLRLPEGGVVIAVEDFFGRGASGAVAGRVGDRILVTGSLFPDRGRAYQWAEKVATEHDGSRLIVGKSLEGDAALARIPVSQVDGFGTGQTRPALASVRELLAAAELVHDGGDDLTEQVTGMQVTTGPAGLAVPPRHAGRTDLARCAAWAVLAIHRTPIEPPAIF